MCRLHSLYENIRQSDKEHSTCAMIQFKHLLLLQKLVVSCDIDDRLKPKIPPTSDEKIHHLPHIKLIKFLKTSSQQEKFWHCDGNLHGRRTFYSSFKYIVSLRVSITADHNTNKRTTIFFILPKSKMTFLKYTAKRGCLIRLCRHAEPREKSC